MFLQNAAAIEWKGGVNINTSTSQTHNNLITRLF
jgi:hypothetical protein